MLLMKNQVYEIGLSNQQRKLKEPSAFKLIEFIKIATYSSFPTFEFAP